MMVIPALSMKSNFFHSSFHLIMVDGKTGDEVKIF